jgi:hypothetical protein
MHVVLTCLSTIAAGIVTALLLGRTTWRAAFLGGVLSGLVIDLGAGLALDPWPTLMVTTAFGVLIASALALPYSFRGDVTDACVVNLRYLTIISVAGIVLYVLVTDSEPKGRNDGSVLYVLVCSFGAMLAQTWFTRYAQARATHLSNHALRYGLSGLLALGEWFRTLGPLLKNFVRSLLILAVLLFISPWLVQALSHLKRHPRSQQVQQLGKGNLKPSQWLNAQPHSASHMFTWAIPLAIACALFAILLVVILRKQTPASQADSTAADGVGGVRVTRDARIAPFRLMHTDDPVRQAYQKRLLHWHRNGATIGRSESPREFLHRVPQTAEHTGDLDDVRLTEAYERARYGDDRGNQEP